MGRDESQGPAGRPDWRPWVLVAAVALVPRLALFLLNLHHTDRWYSPDAHVFRMLAMNLLDHGAYSDAGAAPWGPYFLRPPGYPIFMAAVYGLAGRADAAVIAVQLVLSVATCLLLVAAAHELLGRLELQGWGEPTKRQSSRFSVPSRDATKRQSSRFSVPSRYLPTAAGLVQALSLSGIVAAQYLLSETVFTFLLVLQLWLALRYLRTGSMRAIIGGTVLLAAMVYVRPIAQFWIVGQCALLLCERRLPWTRRLTRAALSLALFAALIGPWCLRNRIDDGAWFLTTNGGVKLLDANVAAMEARRTGEPLPAIRERYRQAVADAVAADPARYGSAHAQDALRMAMAREIIRKHPLDFVLLSVHAGVFVPNVTAFFELIGQTSGQRGTLDVLTRQGLVAATRHYFGERVWLLAFVAPWMALLGAIYLAAAVAAVRWLRQGAWVELALLAFFAGYYLALAAPAGEPRYREPAMPMLILAAVAAVLSRPGNANLPIGLIPQSQAVAEKDANQARPANPKRPGVLTCPGRALSTNHSV